VDITRLGPGDADRVLASASLFDHSPRRDWTALFLSRDGHHLLVASVDGVDAGFVTGVEMTHPDKGSEMFLYELGVAEPYRRRGVGRALVEALAEIARERGCYGMWVATGADNVAALATYGTAGAAAPEPGVTLAWRFE
jgi:ribosomal protein S18 acetylase RimI-like enzyme